MFKNNKSWSSFILLWTGIFFSLGVNSQTLSDQIKINQAGYYPNAKKIAVVTANTQSEKFFITSTNLRDTLYVGILGDAKQSAYSKTTTRLADFSSLVKKGSYVVLVPGVGSSYVFKISDDLLQETAIATLKGFYYQRASMPLLPEYAGKWHRSAGHPDNIVMVHPSAATEKRPAGTQLASPGGWYDAGDYNKYIVNSGITMGTLLSAYEDFPAYFKSLQAGIPESKNDIPDILDEVVYNLRWMLSMQDPNDGGVYHKCTNAVFDGMVMPGVTTATRYVVQKSTAASLDFAAVTAQASRILKQFENHFPKLADSCRNASIKAWEWSLKNPELRYRQSELNKNFSPEIRTGEYGDGNLKDEWMWAACELYALTKENRYLETIRERMNDVAQLPSWGNVGMLGYYTLLRLKNDLPAPVQNLILSMKDTVLKMAEQYLSKSKENAFSTVMGQSAKDYNWGGNSVAANQGILLIRAYLLTKEIKFLEGALSNMDYILGRNATGYSFITGIGSKTPMHPHHRQSESDGIVDPVPGLVVGGPNLGMQDSCIYPLKEIETAYVDVVCSYASNEIAINWNAPVVYLANVLEALKNSWLTRKK